MCFLPGVEGVELPGLGLPLQGCVSASMRVPDISPHSRGTSQGPTTLWQSLTLESRVSFPTALRSLSDKGCSSAAGAAGQHELLW